MLDDPLEDQRVELELHSRLGMHPKHWLEPKEIPLLYMGTPEESLSEEDRPVHFWKCHRLSVYAKDEETGEQLYEVDKVTKVVAGYQLFWEKYVDGDGEPVTVLYQKFWEDSMMIHYAGGGTYILTFGFNDGEYTKYGITFYTFTRGVLVAKGRWDYNISWPIYIYMEQGVWCRGGKFIFAPEGQAEIAVETRTNPIPEYMTYAPVNTQEADGTPHSFAYAGDNTILYYIPATIRIFRHHDDAGSGGMYCYVYYGDEIATDDEGAIIPIDHSRTYIFDEFWYYDKAENYDSGTFTWYPTPEYFDPATSDNYEQEYWQVQNDEPDPGLPKIPHYAGINEVWPLGILLRERFTEAGLKQMIREGIAAIGLIRTEWPSGSVIGGFGKNRVLRGAYGTASFSVRYKTTNIQGAGPVYPDFSSSGLIVELTSYTSEVTMGSSRWTPVVHTGHMEEFGRDEVDAWKYHRPLSYAGTIPLTTEEVEAEAELNPGRVVFSPRHTKTEKHAQWPNAYSTFFSSGHFPQVVTEVRDPVAISTDHGETFVTEDAEGPTDVPHQVAGGFDPSTNLPVMVEREGYFDTEIKNFFLGFIQPGLQLYVEELQRWHPDIDEATVPYTRTLRVYADVNFQFVVPVRLVDEGSGTATMYPPITSVENIQTITPVWADSNIPVEDQTWAMSALEIEDIVLTGYGTVVTFPKGKELPYRRDEDDESISTTIPIAIDVVYLVTENYLALLRAKWLYNISEDDPPYADGERLGWVSPHFFEVPNYHARMCVGVDKYGLGLDADYDVNAEGEPPEVPFEFVTKALINGETEITYKDVIRWQGGELPFLVRITADKEGQNGLPPGIDGLGIHDDEGEVTPLHSREVQMYGSGTEITTSGTYTFTVWVEDTHGEAIFQDMSLIVGLGAPPAEDEFAFLTTEIPDGTLGQDYLATIQFQNGIAPFNILYGGSSSAADWPPGITLNYDPELYPRILFVSGDGENIDTPGDYSVTLEIEDADDPFGSISQTFYITIGYPEE